MKIPTSIYISTAVLLAVLFCSCVTVKYDEDITNYGKQIARLQKSIVDNPRNAGALRDLGVIYFQARQYQQGKDLLKRSLDVDPDDPKALFYYGMTLEGEENTQAALATYIRYTDVSSLSPYRPLMEGRYRELSYRIVQLQLQQLVADEERLGDAMSPTAVAVFPLTYQGTDKKYETLGFGLSEMIISDLGQVQKLKLVERIRLEALLSELRFGATQKIDPTTAPRIGKLLAAGRIVGGTYTVTNDKVLRMDVSSWDVPKKKYPEPAGKSDDLENLFRLQKQIVFRIIGDIGITLTRAERERIERVPTENLQAFILYSLGIERESARDFQAAEVYYNQAVALDPNFSQARSRAEVSGAMSVAGGSRDRALVAANIADPPPGPEGPAFDGSLVTQRLRKLDGTIGAEFFPGDENRKGAEEAARGGAAVIDLPQPPPPPR
ncbi:MAG: CsgG/HfaB family protein [Bacteroidota bacterium]